MPIGDIERLAESAHRRAGYSARTPVSSLTLANILLGRCMRQAVFDLTDHDVEASIVGGPRGPSLLVRASLPPRAAEWFGARALAAWIASEQGVDASPAELDLFAACLRAPRPAVELEVERSGPAFSDLADAFRISESAAALRYGEVTGAPLALVAPKRPIRVRGRRRPGIRWTRVPLSDAPGRHVLLGA